MFVSMETGKLERKHQQLRSGEESRRSSCAIGIAHRSGRWPRGERSRERRLGFCKPSLDDCSTCVPRNCNASEPIQFRGGELQREEIAPAARWSSRREVEGKAIPAVGVTNGPRSA